MRPERDRSPRWKGERHHGAVAAILSSNGRGAWEQRPRTAGTNLPLRPSSNQGASMAKKGRPSTYSQEVAEQAYKLCLLGATDEQLADFFEVDVSTISRWKNEHEDFREALKGGKAAADANVANSLYRRALGYSHEAVKIVADAKTGAEHIVPFTEHYPPDTTACIFWLKNRQRDQWRDKQETEHSGPNGAPIQYQVLTGVPRAPDDGN